MFIAPRDLSYEDKVRKTEVDDVKDHGDIVLFWGGYMSQWYPSQFIINNNTYNCAEQAMMAVKANLFGDTESFERIMYSKYPRGQKEIGRAVRGYTDEAWQKVCRMAVFWINVQKFQQNPELKKLLLATDGKLIAEASPHDKIWGIGLGAEDPRALIPKEWQGTNWLGNALMIARIFIKMVEEGAMNGTLHTENMLKLDEMQYRIFPKEMM